MLECLKELLCTNQQIIGFLGKGHSGGHLSLSFQNKPLNWMNVEKDWGNLVSWQIRKNIKRNSKSHNLNHYEQFLWGIKTVKGKEIHLMILRWRQSKAHKERPVEVSQTVTSSYILTLNVDPKFCYYEVVHVLLSIPRRLKYILSLWSYWYGLLSCPRNVKLFIFN